MPISSLSQCWPSGSLSTVVQRRTFKAASTRVSLILVGVVLCTLLGSSRAEPLVYVSPEQIDTVSARLQESALKSWELGTRAQAVLELNATRYSVFTTASSGPSVPPPSDVSPDTTDGLAPFYDIARSILADWDGTPDGPPTPLMPDGSAADPASNGVTFLVANWTGLAPPDSVGEGVDYMVAAKSQLDYLYSDSVPKTSDGAISHRNDQLQLWSDYVFMVPPFLAYYGVLTQNQTMLFDAYNQCKLYRGHLRDPATGLWRHVVLGETGNDEGFWSTGNGWAAAGMLRVYATIKHSQYANSMKNEMNDLATWVEEVHQAMYSHVDSTHIFTNYADRRPSDRRNDFYDASGTALVAATVYRASLELGESHYSYLQDAQKAWNALFRTNETQTSGSGNFTGYTHFTEDGWLTPVVNPHSYGQEGSESAEGQAFVVMLYAARRDWTEAYNGGMVSTVPLGALVCLVSGITFSLL